ncbi:aldehyde dehydrogenase family protein [Crenobacter sp. SG2303]|uniref:Aldehyde dehydrogenase family protein n=1 Tax=Crenobacter oryzisoli TaxID=3056844 RepID=A0ABT7XT62_9NEIS|nr:aldehyde dehydrogenase family protein [Crenobacter sp. SG2303]MDN0076913.1 aldehyde dehydrogenase family protein [Crenobacter sp. SG2303]
MSQHFSVISPVDGSELLQRPYHDAAAVRATLDAASLARKSWRQVSLTERKLMVGRAVDELVARRERIAEAITRQIGRPISQSPGEVRGLEERARTMIELAEEGLADVRPAPKAGFERFLRREPLGTVLVLAPWNFPFLTAINTIVPALVAGNTVILKHSSQTPLVAELFDEAFKAAGLPAGVFQILHLDHAATLQLVASEGIDFVAFTGSVEGGRTVQRAAADRFIGLGLELGGKDPAYVREDADLASAIENLVDGAFFNSGQSCCGIERIYVHRRHYDDFVAGFVELTKTYRFGSPLDANTNLGPMVRASAAAFVRQQTAEAIAQGAQALIPAGHFVADAPGTAYLAPQVLVNVHHGMRVMSEESFGPVIGIMPVDGDEQALQLMNDSRYGLTASIWTADRDAAIRLGERLETGTVFMNRCDYLDPTLAWTGVKDTGRGISLSVLGYSQLTRIKSFHLKD